MKIRWSPSAEHHLRLIEEFIAVANPAAAVQTILTIIEAVERLTEFQASGRPGRVPHTREVVVSGTSYIVAYLVSEDWVEIAAVIHGAREWPETF